jgi:signal transduction histidine kinase
MLTGFVIWGVSTAIYPINFYLDPNNMSGFQVILFAVGTIITGSGMSSFIIHRTRKELEIQHSLSTLMSGVIQHDIRNYVLKIRQALKLAQNEPEEVESMINLAQKAATSMSEFVHQVSRTLNETSRFEASKRAIDLAEMIDDVINRVSMEYDLDPNQIEITLDSDCQIMANPIIREVLWNIIDNAFKHGSRDLQIQAEIGKGDTVKFRIDDTAGGMNERVRQFLNDPDSLHDEKAPGMGLGIILIRGLTSLCGVRIKVFNNQKESEVIGTTYRMEFDLAKQ